MIIQLLLRRGSTQGLGFRSNPAVQGVPASACAGSDCEQRSALAGKRGGNNWVAVKELKLSYYIGETLLFTIYIYTHYGNLI